MTIETGVHGKLKATFSTQLVRFVYRLDVLFGSLITLVGT